MPRPFGVALAFLAFGASLCVEDVTEHARIMIWAVDVAGGYDQQPIDQKRAVVPFFLLNDPGHNLDPNRVRVVRRYYLFGLISTSAKYKSNRIAINIRPPTSP